MNLLTNKGEYVDKDMADFSSEMLAEGHSFFIYRSDSVDALASLLQTSAMPLKITYLVILLVQVESRLVVKE